MFPTIKINSHTADDETGRVEVFIVENGKKDMIWSKGRKETDQGHKEIV